MVSPISIVREAKPFCVPFCISLMVWVFVWLEGGFSLCCMGGIGIFTTFAPSQKKKKEKKEGVITQL